MGTASLSRANGSHVIILKHWNELPPPLFVLAPPRSFTSLVCAMLGQHPQMYGLPEVHLFPFESMGARAEYATGATFPMAHGLLRAVAQLYFGSQSPEAIRKAQQWLTARSSLTTNFIFKVLADKVFPRVPVEKSPSNVYRREVLDRIHTWFPRARFIHLLRHPRGYGKSVIKYIEERSTHGPIPPSHWLLRISSYPPPNAPPEYRADNPVFDPQNGWYALQNNILGFLNTLPADRRMRVRGEDLLTQPDRVLPDIAAWMGLRTDREAIERMKHPEQSPYAFLGPPGARYGNDAFFLQDPVLRPSRAAGHMSLEGPLEWRDDGAVFCSEVKQLAQEFGYE